MITFTPLLHLQIGPLSLVTHGVMLALGFLVAFVWAYTVAKKRGLNRTLVENVTLVCLLSGLIGARLAWLLVEGRDLPVLEMFQVWNGGLSSHGGYILGILAGVAYLKWKKVELSTYADLLLPAMLLGWAIGRIGCLNAIGEWGWPLDQASPLAFEIYGVIRYPTSLFESLAYLTSFLIVLSLYKFTQFGRQPLIPSALSLFLFTLSRFLIDFLREYSPDYLLFTQVVTGALAAMTGIFLIWKMSIYLRRHH